jgi:hypothetical protein
MRILPRYKIEKALSKDKYLKLHMSKPYFRNGFVYATNGHIMVKIPPSYMEDHEKTKEGHLDIDLIKLSRKREDLDLEVKQDASLPKYPDCETVMSSGTKGEVKLKVTLNAKLLYELSQAMGDDCVVLSFRGDTSHNMIEVTGKHATGALMPMRGL